MVFFKKLVKRKMNEVLIETTVQEKYFLESIIKVPPGALVAQLSKQAPFTSRIVGLILTADT